MKPRLLRALALLMPSLLLVACSGGGGLSDYPQPIFPVAIVTTSLPPAVTGQQYILNSVTTGTTTTVIDVQVQAEYGTAPYTFSISTGSLPAGLTLSSSGYITGTPTSLTGGTSSFTVTVTDSSLKPATATATLSITVTPVPIITTTTLPNGQVGVPYSATIAVSYGTPPFSFQVTDGSLPAGLTLNGTTGVISGTPTAATPAGTPAAFTVTVTDSQSEQATQMYTITIVPAPLSFTTETLPGAQLNTAYSATLPSATGGTSPYTYAITSGTLPTGLTLNGTTGVISGTPTALGSSSFTVQATDSGTPPQAASASFSILVVNALVTVNTGSVLSTVTNASFGVHTSVYDSELDDTSRLPSVLSTGGITVLRYPGGIYADVYHWAQYSITPFDASTSPACGDISNGYLAGDTDFGKFVKTLQATGTQAIITVNYGTSVANATASKSEGTYGDNCSQPNTFGQPEEAAAWVAYANGDPSSTQVIGIDAVGFNWQTVGYWASLRAATPISPDDGYNFLRLGQTAPIGVQYWELGNEIFYNGYNNNQNSEDDLHAPYIYPDGYSGSYDSRANVSALSPTSYGTNAQAFLTAMHAVDPSIKIGLVLSSPNVDPIPSTWNPAAIQAACTGGSTFDFGIFHYYPGSYTATTAAQLFSDPQTNIPALISGAKSSIQQYCSNASSVQFFITETNDNFGLASGTPQQVLGLYAAHDYLTALESGIANIDWLELHNGYLSGSEAPQPAYYGIEMAHLLANVGDSLVSSSSSNSSVLVHATANSSTGKAGIFLLNTDPSNPATVQVTVTGSTLGTSATDYSYGVSTTQSGAALTGTPVTFSGNTFTMTVPPYTALECIAP